MHPNILDAGNPLLVIPEVAAAIGLNEAIVLQQIHYWTSLNIKKKRNYADGHFWTYNSYGEWNKQFPFWNEKTIRRTFSSLEQNGLVISGVYNKMKRDRTKWYRVNYDRLNEVFPSGQNVHMDMDKMSAPLPETITENNKENIYLFLSKEDHVFIDIYLNLFKQHLGKEHMRVNKESYEYIMDQVRDWEAIDVYPEQWAEQVNYHLSTLSPKNNGNIIAFLRAAPRYFL